MVVSFSSDMTGFFTLRAEAEVSISKGFREEALRLVTRFSRIA